MIRIALGFGGFRSAFFPFALFLPLGETLAVVVEADGDGQGEHLGRCPGAEGDEQAQHDPIVSPTDQGLGATGDERVVMHAGAVEGQPAFATQGVVDGPDEGGAGGRKA